jgi:TP901 family phage tail tape measure protein
LANKNAYNILIGADITNFKNHLDKEVSEVVSKVAKDYPIKIKLNIEGLEKANKDISDLANKLKSLGSDVDFSKVKKESKEAGDVAKKSQEQAKKSYRETKQESDEYLKSLSSEISLLKEIETVKRSSTGKMSKETTKVAGNDYRKMTVKEGDKGSSTIKTEINHEKIKNDHLKAREGILTAIQGIESNILNLKSKGLQEESQYNKVLKEIDSIRDGGTKDIKEQISGVESLKSQYETILNLEKEIGLERDRQSKIDKLKTNADTKIFEDVLGKEDINKVYQKINEVSASIGGTTVEFDDKLKDAENTLNRIVANQPDIQFLEGQDQKLSEAKQYLDSLNMSQEEYLYASKEVERAEQLINNHRQNGAKLSKLQKDELKNQIAVAKNVGRVHEDTLKERKKQQLDLEKLVDRFDTKSIRASRAFNSLDARDEFRKARVEIERINEELERLTTLSGRDFDDGLNNVKKEIAEFDKMVLAGRNDVTDRHNSMFGRLGEAMKKIPVWMSAMTMFYAGMRQIQQGFQGVLDIDASMTNLRKVTSGTTTELREFEQTATDIGNTLGVLTKEAIDSATQFQKLGYTLQESTELSKNAILYSNVGDMNIDDATTSIISTIKGFGIEVDSTGQSVRKVVDVFNEVSNNFAISQQGIGEALQRSASTLYQAGNTLEQSVALVTSANASVQDPQKVGNALKTVAMRIRGVDEEGEEIKELIPELEGMFNSFGETIMLDEDTFKSTFDIMQSLKDNWEDLSDIEQANITEKLGGKRQGAIVSAMIQNWDDAEGSYEAGLNSAGSATREMEKYMESIQYRMNQLRVASETFWNTLLDKDALKLGIDLLTDLVNVMTQLVDAFGSTAILTTGATLFSVMGSKQLRESVFNIGAMRDGLASIPAEKSGRDIATTATQTTILGREMGRTGEATKSASMSLRGFGIAGKHVISGILKMTAWIAVISTATNLVIKLANREKEARERNIERLEDEITAYERLQTAKESVNFDEFMSLHSKNVEELDTSQYERYIGLRDDVIDAMPEMIAYYDSEREAVLKTAEAIRKMNKAKDEEYEKNKRKLFEEELDGADYSELERSVGAGAGLVRDSNLNQSRIEALEFAEDFLKEQIAGMNLPIEEMDKKAIELRKEFQRRLEESNLGAGEVSSIMMEFDMNVDSALIQGDVDSAKNFLNRAIDSLQVTNDEINEKINDNKEDIQSNMESFTADVNEMFGFILKDMDVETDSNEFVFLTTFKDEIVNNLEDFANGDLAGFIKDDLPSLMSEAFSSLEAYDVDLDSLMNMTGTSEEMEQTFNTLISKVNDGSSEGERLASVLRSIRDSLIQVAQKNKEVASSFNWARDVNPILTGFVDEISDLDSAYRDLADGQEMSLSQTFDLIDAHPELIDQMEIENGTIKITGESIRELASIKEKAFKADLESKRQEAKNAKAMAETDIRAILTRVNAYGVLIDAKQKVANIDLKELEQKGQEQLRQGNYWGYSEAMHAKHEVGSLIGAYQDLGAEEARLTKLLNFDFTSNLGSITGGSSSSSGSKSGKSDATKELQDAIYVTDEYTNKIDNLNRKIAEQQAIQSKYSEGSKQYQNSIKEEIRLTEAKEKAINNEIKSLEKQIKNKNIQKTGLIRLDDDSDNKTARAKRAEIQQEIDEATKRLNSLYSESYSIGSQIESLNMELVSAISAGFEKQRDTLDNEINYIEYSMGLYNESSKAYERLVNRKITKSKEAEKTYRDEIRALESQLKNNKNLTQAQREEIVKMLNATEEALLSTNEETREMINLLHELEMNKTFEKIAREAEAYSKAITRIRDKMEYDIDEDDYKGNISALKEIMQYNKGQSKDIEENIKKLKQQRKEFEGNHEAQAKINEEIRKQEDALYDSNMAIKDNQKEMENYYSQIADTYVEIYKEQLESQRRAEEKKYEETMKLEDKAHRKRMKHLDEQMDAISDIYDKQIDELDKEDAERTFNMDLQGLQEEERKIRERINILSLDDSYRARAEREELEEQLSDKLSEIEELKYQRELTLRKENLKDLKEEEIEKVESKREGYEEDYENFTKNQEELREEREKHWEDMLNDEEKFSHMRENIMNGHFSNMLEDLTAWDKDVSSRMEGLGNSVERNLTSKIREAIDELTGLKNMSIPDYDSIKGKDLAGEKDYVSEERASDSVKTDPTDAENYDTNKTSSSSSSSSSNKSSEPSKPKTQKGKTIGDLFIRTGIGTQNRIVGVMKKGSEMQIMGEKNGWYNVKYGNKTGWSSGKWIAKLNKGGITPKFSGGKIAMLHEQEMIANKVQTKDILKTAKIVDGIKDILPKGGGQSDIMKSISSKLNSIDYIKLQNAIKNAVGGSSEPQVVNYNYDLDVNVDNFSGDRKELDAVSRQLMTKLKREKGGRV